MKMEEKKTTFVTRKRHNPFAYLQQQQQKNLETFLKHSTAFII